jgi:gluconolactonase
VYDARGAAVRLLGRPWQPPRVPVTGYEVPIAHPYVSGFLFLRAEGTMVAYDLRAWEGSFRPPPAPFANNPAPAGAEPLTRIDTGERFNWSMQPTWWAATNQIVVPDYREDRLWAVSAATGRGDVLREELPNPNFATLDPHGNLAFPSKAGLIIATAPGKETIHAPADGEDAIFRKDGNLYLSTGYGLVRISPAKQRTTFDNTPDVHGLLLSADGNTLYASIASQGRILRFPLAADGTPGPPAVHLDLKPIGARPSGMCHDEAGNFYIPGASTLYVVSPAGAVIARYWAGGYGTTGCTFGDADRKTLYVSTKPGLYRTRVEVPGLSQ